ncbi:hypothetical protein [Acinetobacter terrae]|uniref:Uncharacterized protein n=1 Tax=Acinetobacter terrae TaxID=2731247 RepID=A0A8E4FDT8_9GAMM|nr:hypothetical protein [Acinetobacter terrae]NNH38687.1 hypothetical protein [Acinetobacter terrae]NNH89123.1 hypothetical protein [Acinetobacter terrae]
MRRLEEQLKPGQNQQYCAILDEAHAWAGDAKNHAYIAESSTSSTKYRPHFGLMGGEQHAVD